MTAVATGEIDSYRNLEPKSMLDETKRLTEAPWTRRRETVSGLALPAFRSPT